VFGEGTHVYLFGSTRGSEEKRLLDAMLLAARF
jgi:hypothetical protein